MSYQERKEFGLKLRKARKKKKLTQLELSQEIGISQSNLSKIESGIAPIDLFTWIRIERLVDLPYKEVKSELMSKQ